jgi:hypothetical protein
VKFLILIMTILTLLSIISITESKTTAYAEEDTKKELCKENGGKWEGGACDFKTDNEDKADQFIENVEKIENFEEEKAALEDALCDDEDAKTTNIKICSSQDLTVDEALAEKYNKENCKDYNGEWIDGECDFYENQMKEGWEVDEQEFYEEICKGDDDSKECQKHKESIEDGD